MSKADEEWYCRIEGRVEGPVTARALKTRAALGDLIPSDEVRNGLGGNWQLAKSVRGLQSSSTIRKHDVAEVSVDAGAITTRYRYKMVQLPPTIQISERTPKTSAASMYLESLVNEQASEGWEFYRVDSIGVRVQPGCLGAILVALSGQSNITELHHVITFRKLA